MVQPKMGFIVYGVHKDGLKDPLGKPFIDQKLIEECKKALKHKGLRLVEHPVVIATKKEAIQAFAKMKQDPEIDGVILFSGTWVWAAHLIGAVRDFSFTGKGILIWTHPGSRGWRPVGGLVMHGALLEVGIHHRFVYGAADQTTLEKIAAYCRACFLKDLLNMSTIGAFGGRGMGQTCGRADPSQWMRTFGVDIDTRDTLQLIQTAEKITPREIEGLEPRLKKLFGTAPEKSVVNQKSISLYLALKKVVEEEQFDFYTIQSFPGIASTYAATCFAQSMMLEDGYGTSTLGDFNTALTTLLLTKLSGERVYYGDLQHIDRKNNEIKIIGDGACPPSLAGKVGPAGFAVHGIPTEGEAGGLAVKLVCKVGEGVIAQTGRVDGQFQMVICPVSIFEPPADQVTQRLNECGIPFWPHGFVSALCNIEELIQNWTSEYACLGYGKQLLPALAEFCELTGIKAVLP
ncbi:MAG: hypothetical protein ACOC7U_00745 [Spirochaetota bacterium]